MKILILGYSNLFKKRILKILIKKNINFCIASKSFAQKEKKALKWYRNYKHAAKLPYLNAHKDLYFYFFGFLIIILAFNWNNLSYDDAIRGWNTQSFAYIPNITKISIIFFTLSYILIRSVLTPLQKGVPFLFLIINMPMMIVLSIILDIVKSIAFFNARFFKF